MINAARALLKEDSKEKHILHSALLSGIHSVDFERMTAIILRDLNNERIQE